MLLFRYISFKCYIINNFSIAINTGISMVIRCIITNWMITMRASSLGCTSRQNRTNCGQLDFLSFSSVLELSKQCSNGAVMALLLPICIDFYCFCIQACM